ncbi:Anaerobic glycerol-3-phosphate dehydrogenase subunit C [Gemmata obscuriglobus]|uniref:FAD-binding and (Fe-S)-binding domain-containing protein n=1 Tax=Gemmata obscuriglobus TaxID=114 RepID=UPI00016C4912|nr:FAD-binding and (Fe-S)-binding domain-containing protein [Gemmata obscuriglobus]QEG25327.1 Anaerobic glycerol-3-phosphate dehydrogenase subunit C [Gemmata obscuriglobus]VTR98243.1 d-lactate dehydrogenase : D-lactate dehydrogenase (Cytochrome) OS=Pirellula staleyi (strain ATCC 27377 / DSM 6068 / ICPB 4128) GN=Psta_2342 PE=4 SV=1: FAD_binding_4: FAD-oxidase_C: Fer4_8 [Gemmata obscuriglobus UQM 2246]
MFDETQIIDDLRGSFRGRLHFDRLTRGLYATDASPFHTEPALVAVPEDVESVANLVRYCHEHAIPLAPRGAGTGLSGESLTWGVVLDLSRHFRQVLAIGPDTVTVQAGAVLADLNAELARVGRRFAPNPASAATCTIGGMIATNASGANAFLHGYTRDHVAGLGVVWNNGERDRIGSSLVSESTTAAQHEPGPQGPSEPPAESHPEEIHHPRQRAITRAVTELLTLHAERIATARVRTAFDRCAYQLHGVLGGADPDLTKLLVGSEGTLAIVTEATLRTVPVAGGTCLSLIGFPTLDAAVRAGLALRQYSPVLCDLLERRLLALTRGYGIPTVGAALLVGFEADSERRATERAWGAVESLQREHILRVLAEPTCTPEGVAHIRNIRDAAVSGLHSQNGPRPVACIEDVGVPAEALPEFLTRVQDILKRFELSGTFLVHALTGQVHTRPLLDLGEPTDRAKLWPLAESVHALALALGGTVSSQHGTGIARTPWVERQFGTLMPVFRELKRIFDPKGILNPGKIVGPDPSREAWPLRKPHRHEQQEEEASQDGRAESEAETGSVPLAPEPPPRTPLLLWTGAPEAEAARCNGCGDCRTRTPPERMCPAFRSRGDEHATPRGMANMLRVLRDPTAATPDEVRTVAELCVNCKMCRDECPAKVNVPKLMLETKAQRHAEHGLERGDWVLARTEGLAALGSNFAPLVNALLGRRSARWLLEKFLGVSRRRRLPAFHLRTFFRRARGLGLMRRPSVAPALPGTPRVALFADVFASYNDPLIGVAAVRVLQHHGIEVHVPSRQVGSGVAPLAKGDLDTARERALRNIRVFADLTRHGFRIVCLEPTSALMLTQDYQDILDDPDAIAVAAHTVELTTYLGELHAAKKLRTDFQPLDVTLGHHIPCHMKALRGAVRGPGLLELIPGVKVHTIDAGCSGMAGTWGLKAENFDTSLVAGAGMLTELNRPRVLFGSTECSACRMQMEQGSGKRTLHPIQYLAYAYGLLPELEERFRKPLGGLVSD